MATVFGGSGDQWTIELDAFVVEEIRSELNIDLADPQGVGWHTIATRSTRAVQAAAIACREQFQRGQTDRQFAKQFTAGKLTELQAALEAAGEAFFPPSEWSAMQSGCKKCAENNSHLAELEKVKPLLAAIDAMPKEMREGAMEELTKQIQSGGTSISSEALEEVIASASGPGDVPSSVVTDSPASAESAAAV